MSQKRNSGKQPKYNNRSFTRAVEATFQPLEQRMMLSVSVGSSAVKPAIQPLAEMTALPKATAKSLTSAGAGLFAKQTSIVSKARAGSTSLSMTAASAFTLDLNGLRSKLASAPMEFTAGADRNAVILALPSPDGGFARFKVVEAPIMEAGLANQLPGVKTFRGQGVDDPYATIRMDYTPLGFHAQVLSPNGAYYIDPYYLNDVNGTYVSYFKRDALRQGTFEFHEAHDLGFEENHRGVKDNRGASLNLDLEALPFGTQLKTYRAVVAANRFYTNAVGGGTQAGGQAAIVTAMNRVNGVYETELCIRMTLVANNINVVYTNTNGDPYSNSTAALNQNITNLNNVIGNANFDIGHVFTTGSGGVALLGVVGTSQKAGGTTGLPSPIGDVFYIDYVAHEMGHQWGANHTFNASDGQRNASTAYEVGSGSQIMGYAGLFGADNVQSNSDPYFTSSSIDEIRNRLLNVIPAVGTPTATPNNPPTVPAQTNYTIPTATPFALTAVGVTDPDGDALTYDWQERELGPAGGLNMADNGTSPLNRMRNPLTSPTRNLPILSSILNGTNQTNNASGRPVERLPAVARANSYNWRLIVRDNKSGGGGLASADITLNVVNTGLGGFLINTAAINSAGATWAGGSFQNLTWNVAGTTGNGINVANVKISMSTDGGNTFPIVLAASTPNDGSESIQMPFATGSSQARIKVEAIGNIFFDINNANFTITNVPVTTNPPGQPVLTAGDTGTSSSDGITRNNNSANDRRLTFDIPNTLTGADLFLYANGVQIGQALGAGTGGTVSVQTDGSTTIADGVRSITARQNNGQGLSQDSVITNITIDTVAPTLSGSGVFGFVPNHSFTYVFSEDLQASINALGAGTLDMFNNSTASSVPAGSMSVNYNGGTRTAVYTFTGLPSQKLADGSYTANAVATDVAGNTVSASPYNFIYAGGATAHTFYVRRSGGDVELYKNTGMDGSPDHVANHATLSQIALEGSAAHDTVTIDFINGNPIPAAFLSFRYVGGTGDDVFNVLNPGTFAFETNPASDTPNMTVNVSAGASVEFQALRTTLGALNINAAGANIPAGTTAVLTTKSLSIANGGQLDLADNDMIIDYNPGDPSPLSIVEGYIFTGRAGGAWNGPGMISTTAGTTVPARTTLGVLEASDFKAIHGPAATFSSEPIDTSAILVKYTYYGDTDLNGRVNFDDYARVDSGFLNNKTGWLNGDFNGDGTINFDDYGLIDLAFLSQGGVVL